MTEPDDFLSRWSRRKREAANGAAAPNESDAVRGEGAEPEQQVNAESRSDADDRSAEPVGEKPETAEPAFDLSKLPSLDSITAETDIRPFLAAGVPASLRQAALRRAWSADPKIRDFIGLAENQWDFTGDSELLGFDFSPPSDVARMVAELFGEKRGDDSKTALASRDRNDSDESEAVRTQAPVDGNRGGHISVTENGSETEGMHAAPEETHEPSPTVAATNKVAVPGPSLAEDRNAAPQNNDAAQREESSPVLRRSHGRAMPR